MWRTVALMAGALVLAACGGSHNAPLVSDTPPERIAMPHPHARFLVRYGGDSFRVNVRYVPLIDESVIAVQKGYGKAREEDWTELTVEALDSYSRVLNYADDAYEPHVLQIAGGVQARGGICPEGSSITMAKNRDGDVRTLYRRNRQAWVVFALCPEKTG